MAFLDIIHRDPPGPMLQHDLVLLRPAAASDFEAWTRLREESRAHLIQWEPDWTPEEMTRAAFHRRLRGYARDMRRGAGLALLIFRREENEALVGGATFSNIRRGAAWTATLGYWIGAPFVRRGYGSAAVAAMLAHAFETLGLNRVEAACQPGNIASRKLLMRAGFRLEGVAKDYLKINGAWRDHEIFAHTAADHREATHPA